MLGNLGSLHLFTFSQGSWSMLPICQLSEDTVLCILLSFVVLYNGKAISVVPLVFIPSINF